MLFAGVIVTFLGFCLAVASVAITQSTGGRMMVVLLGIVVCLVGIIGILNQHCLKNAIWKK